MTRRTPLRKSLIAALALVMGLSPAIARADAYGTLRTSPYQFVNWLGFDLHDGPIQELSSVVLDLCTQEPAKA